MEVRHGQARNRRKIRNNSNVFTYLELKKRMDEKLIIDTLKLIRLGDLFISI